MPGVILDTGVDGYPSKRRERSTGRLGYHELGGTHLAGWSNPDLPGSHHLDPLTNWVKVFETDVEGSRRD